MKRNRISLQSIPCGQKHSMLNTGLILGLRPVDERRRYEVTPSLSGWTQT